jgi:hypothetical protein
LTSRSDARSGSGCTDEDEELVRRFTVALNHVDHVRLWLEN